MYCMNFECSLWLPVRSLPLDQCASGAVSFCGKLKSGKYGITVHPPLPDDFDKEVVQETRTSV